MAMAQDSSDSKQDAVSPGRAASPSASTADLLRWITVLPGLLLVSSSFGFLVAGTAAALLQRPAPLLMNVLIPVLGGWAGVLFAYHWAPNRKWPAALATGLLLGAWRLMYLIPSLAAAGLPALWPSGLAPLIVALAIAAAPWRLHQLILNDRRQQERPCAQTRELAQTPQPEPPATPRPAAAPPERAAESPAPAPASDALRWAVLVPAAAIVYYGALVVAFAPMSGETPRDGRMWLSIAVSFVIGGWVTLLFSAWMAPARKRSVAYAAYLVLLVLSLPLAGRMLIARGPDTAIAIVGLWLVVAAALGPAPWVVQRIWRSPRAHPPAS